MISEDGQKALRDLGNFIPVRPGMAAPKGAPTVQQLNDKGLPMSWGYINRNTNGCRTGSQR